jgi:prepilin-type N-terminal cleavage/methylation domain-containing protein
MLGDGTGWYVICTAFQGSTEEESMQKADNPPKIRRPIGSTGFTLMELMVTVAIIAFVSAALVPSFSMNLLRGRQKEASMAIVAAAFEGRSRAARTGLCHRVRVTTSPPETSGGFGGTVELAVFEDPAPDCSQGSADPASASWRKLSERTIGRTGPTPGEVGADVAIADAFQDVGTCSTSYGVNPIDLYFDPNGGLFFGAGSAPVECIFEIGAYAGITPIEPRQQVRIEVGGAVTYGAYCD